MSTLASAAEQPNDSGARELARLITPQVEAHVFWRLRVRMARCASIQAISYSRLRLTLVLLLSAFFWFGLYQLFSHGFSFLEKHFGSSSFHLQAVQWLYDMFFASLMVLLTCSAGGILYSGVYRSDEAAFLLTTPARPERIVLHKFQEAVFFSGWGFVLMGSPMIVAYGVVAHAPWYYYAMIAPMMTAFVYIPGAIGAILCLFIVQWAPRLRLHWLAWAAITLVVLALVFGSTLIRFPNTELLHRAWFEGVMSRFRTCDNRLLPSWWLSSGLLEAARHEGSASGSPLAESMKYLGLLISNALFCHILLLATAGRIYRQSYSERIGGPTNRKPKQLFWLDAVVLRWAPFLSPQMRLLIAKDSRLFRRDPVQWTQFLVFFGLLVLYFVNIRHISTSHSYDGWTNAIGFLNLAVVGLILSTFTTRFVFPMVSLEGRRIWILNLLPAPRDLILWSKFWFAVVGSSLPCMILILLSDAMLQISTEIIIVHQIVCVMLCLGLSGAAVGLGAAMPDLREQSPSKIAAGFGGTLNLVLSAIYIVVLVLLAALVCHFYFDPTSFTVNPDRDIAADERVGRLWLIFGGGGALVISLAATFLPMRLGLKAFRRLEL